METYVRLVLNLLFLGVSLAVIGPQLISAKDDILYVAGILYMTLAVPGVLYYTNRRFVNDLINKMNGDSN